MNRLAVGVLLCVVATAHGEMLQAKLRAGQPGTLRLESAVDDEHLANPPGYHPAEPPVERVVERVVIENIGDEIARDPDVRLNGRPLLPVADPIDALGVADAGDLLAIFSAWRDRRIHGSTGLRVNRDPLEVLRAFGATFCGDDSNALGAVTIPRGAEVRFVWVSGHSVAEHRMPGGDWALIDGDQNLFYPRWDNRTPAAGADIVADPMLALRVKVFGRNARWESASSRQNTARFEFIDRARPPKILRVKQAPARRAWELWPGERLEIIPGELPGAAHGVNEDVRRDKKLRGALWRVNFYPSRERKALALPFPIESRAAGDPVYEVAVRGEGPVACLAAQSQFPSLRSGENRLTATAGVLRVSFQTRASSRPAVAPPMVKAAGEFSAPPCFEVRADGADRMWWQIGADRDFRFVAPNLDRVGDFAPSVRLDAPIDETFLSAGRTYVFRAKVRRDGVWSDWSAPVQFTVNKPAPPEIRSVTPRGDQTVVVRWGKSPAGEMMVFGSDRIDFLPEIFETTEATRMENGAVKEGRPARNLLATVPGDAGEAVVPAMAAYRLIARTGKMLSVPSPLVRREGGRAKVLQNRHEKAPGALVGRDVAVEMDVP
jgi:hypothetical protein